MRGTGAQGAKGPRPVPGLLKGNLGPLKTLVFGKPIKTGETRGWDEGEGKLWGT